MELFERPEADWYLIIISPDMKTRNNLTGHKRYFRENFGKAQYVQGSIPHCSMFSFPLTADRSERFLVTLAELLNTIKPFQLEIRGFDFFRSKDSKTIYAKVNLSNEFLKAHEIIRNHMLRFRGFKNSFAKKLTQPHFTIAQTSDQLQFEKAWDYYQHLEFRQSFEVSKFRVLRWNSKGYDPITDLKLGGACNFPDR